MRVYNVTALLTRYCWSWPWRHHGFQTSARYYISSYYDVLGIKQSASEKEIKSAYIQLSKKYHPDVSTQPNAQHQFTKVTEAYQILGNSKSRLSYDNSLFSYSNTPTGYTGAHSHQHGSTWSGYDTRETYRSGRKEDYYHDVRRGIKMRKSPYSDIPEMNTVMSPIITILDLIAIIMVITFAIKVFLSAGGKNILIHTPPSLEDTDEKPRKTASKGKTTSKRLSYLNPTQEDTRENKDSSN